MATQHYSFTSKYHQSPRPSKPFPARHVSQCQYPPLFLESEAKKKGKKRKSSSPYVNSPQLKLGWRTRLSIEHFGCASPRVHTLETLDTLISLVPASSPCCLHYLIPEIAISIATCLKIPHPSNPHPPFFNSTDYVTLRGSLWGDGQTATSQYIVLKQGSWH